MTSTAKVNSNRLNAARSTGPRSAAGRKRSAGNALRHALAVPIDALPEYELSITQLVSVITGEAADGSCLPCSRYLAEAEIDLRRVRAAKLVLIQKIDAGRDPLASRAQFDALLLRLARLERYERRARSRRKSAIRDLDAASGAR